MKLLRVRFILFVLFSFHTPANATSVAEFYKKAEFDSMNISPTGEYIAAVMPLPDRSALVIIRLSDMKRTGVFKPEKDAYIDQFRWVSDKRIIFNTAKKLGDLETPYELPGMWAMDFDGENKKLFSAARTALSFVPGDTSNVLIQYDDWKYKVTYGLQDIYTGELTPSKQLSPIKQLPPERQKSLSDIGYFSNGNGKVLGFIAGRNGTQESIYFLRKSPEEPWVEIYDEGATGEDLDFLGFTDGSQKALFRKENSKGGPDSVVAFDLATSKMSVVSKDDNVSPIGVLKSPVDASVYAIRYLDGKPRYEYLKPDNAFSKDHRKLSNSFPGQDVIPLGYTKDNSKAIYYVMSDANPGDYYLYERNTGRADLLFANMQWINPKEMAETAPVKFKSRDGLEIEGFLTLPKNSQKNLPVIIYPHGGPFGIFDTWGFDSDLQMLASRGYAVLQVNFRGSGNYGISFQKAGYQQWGKAMQNDLTDATRWLIDQGVANPKKICIYGASYGAYAAMMGVAREQDLYACAIGYVGVYDLPLMVKIDTRGSLDRYSSGWWLKKFFLETLGTENLDQISPVNLATSIKVPVLLGGGELDETAPIKQTKVLKAALDKSGNPTEMKIYENEGHGNFLMENRLDWANRVLEFLDKNIGSKSGK